MLSTPDCPMSTNKARYANFLANLLLKGQVKPSASHYQRPTLQLESRCALAAGGALFPPHPTPKQKSSNTSRFCFYKGRDPCIAGSRMMLEFLPCSNVSRKRDKQFGNNLETGSRKQLFFKLWLLFTVLSSY